MGLLFHRLLGVTPRIGTAPGGGGNAGCGTMTATPPDAIDPDPAVVCVASALAQLAEDDDDARCAIRSLLRASVVCKSPCDVR
jgi:hypothetical protein